MIKNALKSQRDGENKRQYPRSLNIVTGLVMYSRSIRLGRRKR